MSTYAENASSYLTAGWTGVLPVPVETKFPPPSGYTGGDGADTDPATVDEWTRSHAQHSIALRMPAGVIGIDVDHYDKVSKTGQLVAKRGGDTLAEYEQKWGELPATWRSSARELPSGIRFFRVPVGLKFATVLGDAIEIIQRHHRYAVAAPSVHSETGGVYQWSHPEVELTEEFPVPVVSELPMLPERWVAGLSEHVNQSRSAPASTSAATELLGAITEDPRPMCSMMEIACNRAVAQINAASSGSRHDTAMARTMRVIGLAAEGHTGGAAALQRARDAWDSVTAGESRDYEFDSLVSGAAAQAAGTIESSTPRTLDPCEGGSGLGIEVVTDPGEGNRSTTLIVAGLDDARMCAEYAPPATTVIGVAGHESWRRDGVPVSELRVVAGTTVTVLFGPDVAFDLNVWNAAVSLAESCLSKGAKAAKFTQPPGTSGARVSTYLNSLDEAERAPELAHIISKITETPFKPKPQSKAKKLGADDLFDLPPSDDTTLGTTWADEHLDDYRVITTDKSWMAYRDGRWSVDGAELAVGHSLMEFITEASKPIQLAMLKARGVDQDSYEKFQRAKDAILSARKRQALQSTAMVYSPTHVRRDQLDRHPRLWCAANCVIDLESGRVYDHDPNMLLTTGSDVAYTEGAECERFDQLLTDVLPDPDVRDFVMQVFGMAMLGEVRDHVLPVFIGEGRNGKGALIRIMFAVFGSHAQSINSKALLKRKFDAHEVEIAQLAGKRLAVAEETGQGASWDVARVNEWTGGGRLSGRFMHGNPFAFDPSHTLVMATNHRPSVGQGEAAFWARYKEVPFEVSFLGREDYTLEPHILAHELPGVLNRLLEASARYHRAGKLFAPAAVDVATAGAKVDADNLARFCAEHIAVTLDEADRIVNADLYERVIKWWSQNVRGETPPSGRMFPKEMRTALGFAPTVDNPRKLGQGSQSKRTWIGVRWLDEGGSEINLRPLPLRQPESAVCGSVDLPNPSSVGQGVEDQTGALPQGGSGTADSTADDSHDRFQEPAGQDVSTDDTDDTASKVVMLDIGEEKREKEDQQEENVPPSPYRDSAIGADRQCAAVRQYETPPAGVVTFDLETASADQLHHHPNPREFVRLAAYSTGGEAIIAPSVDELIDTVVSSRWVIGANIVHFDLPALMRIDRELPGGPRIDLLALARDNRILDTMITESVLNPVLNDLSSNAVGRAQVHFKLENACKRYGIEGKTADSKALAKEYDGFDKIPLDVLAPYCLGDVAATNRLRDQLLSMLGQAPRSLRNYVFREHRVHAIGAQMGLSGFLADKELLNERHQAGVELKIELTKKLVDRYQIPTTNAAGKPAKSVVATKEGKEAIMNAFLSLGVREVDIPRTGKGAPSFGSDNVTALAERYADDTNGTEIGQLCEMVGDSWGVRTVYGTALKYLSPVDGRVHPEVATFQASGRWSVTKPGLTVFGKRGKGSNGQPRVLERKVFRAAEGHVLMAIDLSQVDARAIAVHSQDPAYMALFGLGPDGKPLDAHEMVGRMVWGDAVYDSDPKSYRQDVKQITHGVPYGMGVPKLALNAKVPEAVAQRVVDTMNERFPRLQEWKAEVRERAEAGEWMDNGFGRLMLADPARAYTQGPALMGQGTARDLMMKCLLNVDDYDAAHGTEIIKMLRAQIHDEAIFELPAEHAVEIARAIESCFNFSWQPEFMPDAMPINLVAEVDYTKFGRSWDECY